MLKTDCTNCKFTVTSPFLTETKKIVCARCQETFSVKDIYISAGPYTVYKKEVLKDTPRYLRLLRELQSTNVNKEEALQEFIASGESDKALKIFIKTLKDFLNEARSYARMPGGKSTVEYSVGNVSSIGKVKNISATGICIAIPEKSQRIGPGRIIKMNINDTGLSEPLSLRGWVVWSTEKGTTGLKFVGLNKPSREALHKFIAIKGSLEKAGSAVSASAASGA